ncbi:MAG: PAS domain S-box protein, partial [Lentisphaerota bacterium]
MVAKIDGREVYAHLRYWSGQVSAFVGILILTCGLVLYSWWNRQKAGFYRRQYETELQREATVRHYDYLAKYANDIIVLCDSNRRIMEVNDRALEAYGYSREELVGRPMQQLRPAVLVPEQDEQIQRAEERGGLVYETIHRRKDGSEFSLEASLRVLTIDGQRFYQGIFRDISDRKLSEKKIMNLTRMYAVLSEINQCIVRIRDKRQLLEEICRVIVEFGAFRLAWIGFVNEVERVIQIEAIHGAEADTPAPLAVSLADVPEGQGPSSRAVRTGATAISNDVLNDPRMAPWRNVAERTGFKSAASVPIRFNNQIVGVLAVYTSELSFFDEKEINLLDEIGWDISYAMETLDQERLRKNAEDQLEKTCRNLAASEQKYRTLFDASHDGILLVENGRIIDCNLMAAELFGGRRDQLIGHSAAELSPATQADGRSSAESVALVRDAVLAGRPQIFPWRFTQPNGEVMDVEMSANSITWEGRALVQVVARDLRE